MLLFPSLGFIAQELLLALTEGLGGLGTAEITFFISATVLGEANHKITDSVVTQTSLIRQVHDANAVNDMLVNAVEARGVGELEIAGILSALSGMDHTVFVLNEIIV